MKESKPKKDTQTEHLKDSKDTKKDSAKKRKTDIADETEDSSSDSEMSSDDETPPMKPKKKKTKLDVLNEKKVDIDKEDYNLVISKNRFDIMMELLQ